MSALQQVWSRLQLLFGQGKVVAVGRDWVQVRALDDEDDVHTLRRPVPFGFDHYPLGGEAYMAFPAGDRSVGVALMVGDRRYRMDLRPGEVAIHDAQGNHVLIEQDGTITVRAALQVVLDAPTVQVTGDLRVEGSATVVNGLSAGTMHGVGGTPAQLSSGAEVSGVFRVNGVSVDEAHEHVCGGVGERSGGVV